MIVGDDGSVLTLVRQDDHQRQCLALARAWGGAGFARLPRWRSVERAAARHDDGWIAADARPGIGEGGLPVDFPDVPRGVHAAFYEAGVAAVQADDPWAGLVCCLHARGLYERRLGLDGPRPPRASRPTVERAFVAVQLRRQARLERRLGAEAAGWAWDAFRLLQAWDALSLYLTWTGLRRGATWTLASVPTRPGDLDGVNLTVGAVDGRTATVTPWPFAADVVDVPVRVRRVARRAYRSDAHLARVLAATRTSGVAYRVVPGGATRSRGVTPPRRA
ncbi:MAG: DUF3891 family protein [Thermoleophilia bacterium]|nr:DUF3891 family protein [Thermoleophilia bacterium]